MDGLKAKLPELPDEKRARFVEELGLSPYDASVLVAELESADFYETVLAKLVDKARAEDVGLVGPGSLLRGLTKTMLDAALEAAAAPDLLFGELRA